MFFCSKTEVISLKNIMIQSLFPVMLVLLGIGLSLGSYFLIGIYEQQLRASRFDTLVKLIKNNVQSATTSQTDTVYGIAAALPPTPTFEHVRSIKSALDRTLNLYTNLIVTQALFHEDRPEFERNMSKIYNKTLHILQSDLRGGPYRISDNKSSYRPIVYISSPTLESSLATGYILVDTADVNYFVPASLNVSIKSYHSGNVGYYAVYGPISKLSVITAVTRIADSNFSIYIPFSTQVLLSRLLSGQNVIVTMNEPSAPNGILTVYTSSSAPSGTIYTETIGALNGKWNITIWDTSSVSVFAILIPCIIALFFGLLLGTLAYYHCAIKRIAEFPLLKRIQIAHAAMSTLLHEIRNHLNAPAMILNDEHLDHDGIVYVKEAVQQVIRISSNFLVYDQLLQGTSKITLKPVNLCTYTQSVLQPIITGCNRPITVLLTTSAELDRDIMIDSDKYSEIFVNLLTNSIKHVSNDIPLLIRLRLLPGNKLFLEMINSCVTTHAVDTESLYLPYFIREDTGTDLWDSVRRQLVLNEELRQMVLQYIDDNTSLLENSYHITNTKIGSIAMPVIKSIGLGLSIVRLLCKALGGESNIEMRPTYVNQWAIVTYQECVDVLTCVDAGVSEV